MRISLVVYGLGYVMVELIGTQIEEIGWPRLTALQVATVVTNALVTVIVAVAVLIAIDVQVRRWRRSTQAWQRERTLRAAEQEEQGPIVVQAWRPDPLALPAGAAPLSPSAAYGAGAYACAPRADGDWIEGEIVEDGHLL
jgi:peptidoglycan/LPS O-acetylase OafA/YrhL